MEALGDSLSLDGPALVARSAEDREVGRLEKAAEEFEALILKTLLAESKALAPGGDSDSDPASGTLADFGATAFSDVMAKSRGFGIAEALVDAMEAQVRALAADHGDGEEGPVR